MEDAKEIPERKTPAKSGKNANVRKMKIWTAVVLSVIVLVLVVQNRHPWEVNILFWDYEVSGVILLLFVFLVGMAVGYIVRRKR